MIIDAQVHPWEDEAGAAAGLVPDASGEQILAAMDQAGVDGALLVSSWHVYRDDAGYALTLARQHRDRFRVVAPVDLARPDLRRWLDSQLSEPLLAGLRLMSWRGAPVWGADDRIVQAVMRAAAEARVPVCVHCWDDLDVMDSLARLHPDVQLVLDHAGLRQPFKPPARADGLANLPKVLSLARHEKLTVKVTGVCTLSLQPFPFRDLWEPIAQVVEAFGVGRCMWGSDWTRARAVPYDQVVAAFRDRWPLTEPERAELLGGTLRRVFGW